MTGQYVVRIRASTGRGDPVVSWLMCNAQASSAYANAARFDNAAEAYYFIIVGGHSGGDEGGPWCEVVLDSAEEAARQMDEATRHRRDNPWLYTDNPEGA